MRSQQTPDSGLTMHLLLMHLRQWECRLSIFTVLLLAQLVLRGKGGDAFNPELRGSPDVFYHYCFIYISSVDIINAELQGQKHLRVLNLSKSSYDMHWPWLVLRL